MGTDELEKEFNVPVDKSEYEPAIRTASSLIEWLALCDRFESYLANNTSPIVGGIKL